MEVASGDLYTEKIYENLMCQVLLRIILLTLNPTLGLADEQALTIATWSQSGSRLSKQTHREHTHQKFAFHRLSIEPNERLNLIVQCCSQSTCRRVDNMTRARER